MDYRAGLNTEYGNNHWRNHSSTDSLSIDVCIDFIIKTFPAYKATRKDKYYNLRNHIFYFHVFEKDNQLKITARFPFFYNLILIIIIFTLIYSGGQGIFLHSIKLCCYLAISIAYIWYWIKAKDNKIKILNALQKYLSEG